MTTLLIALLLLLTQSCSEEEVVTQPPIVSPPAVPVVDVARPGIIRDISSSDLVAEMGVGWNLGNTFDVISRDKTAWGNPAPTEFQIRKVAEQGFRTLRIPVTWAFHMREFAPYQVESAFLDRVQYIVNLALDNQMHVIINVHHDDEWILPTYQDSSRTKDRLAGLWTQIADRFQPYGDSLIFETINEPRLKGSPEEWSGGTEEGRTVLNTYHKAALDAIRATGGNNTKRHIMISTYAASSVPAAMDALVIPNDDPNVIISTHSYFPWSFCGDENGPSSWGTEEERSGLIAEIDRIYNYWVVERNRPVILGEWGARDKNNVDIRADYFSIYTREATTRGMVPIVWDDGGNFRLLDRTGVVWEFQKLVDAIVDSAQ